MMKASELLELFSAHWSTAILAAGVESNVFARIEDGHSTAEDLARETGMEPRPVRALLDGLTGIGAIDTDDGVRYRNSEAVARFLIPGRPGYLGGFARIVAGDGDGGMRQWSRLSEAFRSGRPVGPQAITTPDNPFWPELAMALQPVTEEVAAAAWDLLPVKDARKVLDVGGGTGAFALVWLRKSAKMTFTQLDWAPMNALALAQLTKSGLSSRFAVVDGDMHETEWEKQNDVVILSNVLHHEPPEVNAALLSRARAALAPGGILVVSEFALDDTRRAPAFALRFHAGMILQTARGACYQASEIRGWMERAGFDAVRTAPVPPLSTLVWGRAP